MKRIADKTEEDILRQFLSYSSFREKLTRQKQTQKYILMIGALLVYSGFIAIYFLNENKGIDIFSLNSKSEINKLEDKISVVEKEVELINQKSDNLEKSIASQNPKDAGFFAVNSRLVEIEKKQSSLYQAIDSDPEKALTVRLIQERQDALKEEVGEVKVTYTNLSNKVDNIIMFIIAVPIISGIFGIAFKYLYDMKKKPEED